MCCAHTVSLFLEEILAYSRHMVRFTLGGGTCSHKLASINTFLVNSLIAARYRRPPALERHDSFLRCVYSLLRNKKEALLKNIQTTALSNTCLELQREKSSSGAPPQHKCGTGGDLLKHVLSPTQMWVDEQRWRVRLQSCMCEPERLEVR